MSLNEAKLNSFLDYKKSKLNTVSNIESKRLDDLKDARTTVFKYALPISIIDAAAGAFGAQLTQNLIILLPVTLFVIMIYLLANNLDLQKYVERTDIMNRTDAALHEIRLQEKDLLRESKI
jgi:hypothetical protein